jgi:hypothetical protein
MLRAADQFLRDSTAFLREAKIRPGPLHVLVPYALWARLMQLAPAITFLTMNGYAEEAKPLTRALLSAAIAIKLVTVDDLRGKPAAVGVARFYLYRAGTAPVRRHYVQLIAWIRKRGMNAFTRPSGFSTSHCSRHRRAR